MTEERFQKIEGEVGDMRITLAEMQKDQHMMAMSMESIADSVKMLSEIQMAQKLSEERAEIRHQEQKTYNNALAEKVRVLEDIHVSNESNMEFVKNIRGLLWKVIGWGTIAMIGLFSSIVVFVIKAGGM